MKTNQTNERKRRGLKDIIVTGILMLTALTGFAQKITSANLKRSEQIRPFDVNIPQDELTGLRQRINATR